MNVKRLVSTWLMGVLMVHVAWADDDPQKAESGQISYYKQIRPIFQAHCQGCHQPAKDSGDYVMTSFDHLLAGGESETAAVVPGKPDESYLVELMTPVDGEAEMPKEKGPLSEADRALIIQWIGQGAHNDTPANAKQRYDVDRPPLYTMQPIVTSIDYSPDGKWLAIAGFHEVLLHRADGSGLAARLIGISERIESVAFSPDGKSLAVTGGLPGRMGEVQVWDVSAPSENWQPELKLSVAVTFDTVYGGRWSPDGKLLSFGCSDNSVRAIDAATGEQVLFQGAHNDWVRDTVFSVDGKHLVSVARDMTVKLTEVATERFVDNISSITPKALKGGVNAVARHPERDEVLIGGADGVPKVYRMIRQTARRIGDDANLIRIMPGMHGRIFGVAISADGKRMAAVSTLDGKGQVSVYSYEFDTSLPEDVKKIMSKVSTQRNAEERKRLTAYHQDGVKQISTAEIPAGTYAVAFHPDNQQLVVAAADGIRIMSVDQCKTIKMFSAAPISESVPQIAATVSESGKQEDAAAQETLPASQKLVSLEANPATIQLTNQYEYAQVLVTGILESGDRVDVTRIAESSLSQPVVSVDSRGLVKAEADGKAVLQFTVEDQSIEIPVSVSGCDEQFVPDFVRDVNPAISRLGCNQGTCHGSANGKNGFKLSLRGYDPIFDVRAFTDDLASRRTNVASPDDSLMLLKSTSAVAHAGGQLTRPGEDYYSLIRDWIAAGAELNMETPRVASVELYPANPVVQQLDARQQMRVLATYADGRVKDVTHEAFITSGNTDVATVDEGGLMSAARRGEAPVLARFEGAYAATTLTVMGPREEFVWKQPPTYNRVDELTAAKWERMKIQPSGLCTDAEFIRRVHLDLTGLPPTGDEVKAFLADKRDSKLKRAELVDRLIGGDEFIEYWTNKWADLLQVNRKFLGAEGAAAFRGWIRNEVSQNAPYDEFVRKVITASGSNKENPPASYYKILRNPVDTMENTTHLFLAIRFNCNKCHDHPFERWTQDQYYEVAAYFAQFELKADPNAKGKRIGGTAVEGAKPLYEIVADKKDGDVVHERTKQVTPPKFPFDCNYDVSEDATRREVLAAWITSANNPYFARSYVNRLWGYMLGVGIIEPIDDIRAGNPPTNPELLDYLAQEFIDQDFDVRHVMRLICKSRTYQLSVKTNRWNEDDAINYSHATARRLPAEVLFDSIHRATGAKSKFPGVPAGTRAAALPDAGVKLPSGFLTTLGKPPRESACECERTNELQLGPVMALVSGPVVGDAIADANNELVRLEKELKNDQELFNEVFLRILNRPATDAEIHAALQSMKAIQADHEMLSEQLKKRQQWWAERKPQLEETRTQRIAKAEADLTDYEQKLAPRIAQQEKERAAKIKAAEAELAKYQAALAKPLAEWEKKQKTDFEWFLLEARNLASTNGANLVRQEDRSIRASGKAVKATYTVTVRTHLKDIRAIRLETLPVAGIKGGGPGLPPNGNFVVTEFQVRAAPVSDPKKFAAVELVNPVADFSQQGFNIKQTLDGKPRDQRGWAVAPQGGTVHWATFETKKPIGHDGGTILQFVIHQYHNAADHRLARFRLSASTQAKPGLSLPESLLAIVSTPAKQRSEAQKKELLAYYQKADPELQKRVAAVALAKQPLPTDPGLVKRRAILESAKQAVPVDRLLTRLQTDVDMSTKQLANPRLTTVQDLAWALINSPAFLFNH